MKTTFKQSPTQSNPDSIAINHIAIEQHARELRALTLQYQPRLYRQCFQTMGELSAQSLSHAVSQVSGVLLRLFSWNPQTRRPLPGFGPAAQTMLSTGNQALKSLFGWNPQAR